MSSASSGRQFLSLPAVQPLPTTAPTSIFRALHAVLLQISALPSASFRTHRLPVRNAVRLVRILLASLPDLPPLSSATFPSILELYISSERLRLLLHDLSRPGSRLLSLLSTPRISAEFRIFSSSFALALDTLPLDDTNESIESLRLAADHARRDWTHADPSDNKPVYALTSAMDSFRNSVPPDSDPIRTLLEHLRIQSWSDCNLEVCFLEEELKLSRSVTDTALYSSVLAFALYARSVCCDSPDHSNLPESLVSFCDLQTAASFDGLNADDFRCPISFAVMTDPVTLSTGQTYDRSSILRWLKSGNRTCPVTGEKLPHVDLLPNLALANVIRQYCTNKRVPLPGGHFRSSALPDGDVASAALRMLASFLVGKLRDGDVASRRRAVHEARLLARSGAFHRSCLVDAGGVQWLLHLLGSWDSDVQGNAMAAVLNLTKHPNGRKAVVSSGGLVHVLDVLSGGSVSAKHNAAAALFYLSSIHECREAISETPGAVASLVELLRSPPARGRRNAAMALVGLLEHAGNLQPIISAGVVTALAEIISPLEKESVVVDALATLAVLADYAEGSTEILRCEAAVRSMADLLLSSDSQIAKDWCVSVLLRLCDNGGDSAAGCLESLPALMPALYSQLALGSEQASKKASSLIRILHSWSEARSAAGGGGGGGGATA